MIKQAKWKQLSHQIRRFFARCWLRFNPHVKIIGITGSYGKTNTTRAIAQVLAEKYRKIITHKRGGLARLIIGR